MPAQARPSLLLVVLVVAAAACGKEIGDECKTSIDCSQEEFRTCDIAQPGGYCTVEGCDERSCPDDSVCIRFFPRLFLSASCSLDDPLSCPSDQVCIPDEALGGVCAPRLAERRYCAATCGGNGDCRGSYECRTAGTLGSVPFTTRPDRRIRFCAPQDR